MRAEKEKAEDQRIRLEKVTLSGDKITSKEIYDRYQDRIYEVIAYNSLGKPVSKGTGFLFKNQLIATNYHVVEDARKITVKSMRDGANEEEVAVLLANELSDWVVLDKFVDNIFSEKQRPSLPQVAITEKIQTGDSVTVIGNPYGLVGSVSNGVVSSTRLIDGTNWIQITAPISKGSSGSPVFDGSGRWIGLATLASQSGQNINLATPSTSISEQIIAAEKSKNIEQVTLPLKTSLSNCEQYLAIEKSLDDNLRGNFDPKNYEKSTLKLKDILKIYPDPEDQDALLQEIQDNYDFLEKYNEELEIIAIRLENDKNNFKAIEGKGRGNFLFR